MEPTVHSLCKLLVRSRLMSLEDINPMQQRWYGEAGKAARDVQRFSQWLVANWFVTPYQVERLLRGHVDRFFLDQYKLLDRLGQGRMAGIFLAVHNLGQVVAVKVLPVSKAKDPQTLARFQREARIALKLRHPNVVRSFQVGEDHGLHYLVMEYLEGETLEDVLKRRGRLPPPEAVRLMHQALLGLQHLHEEDVVHRDLKPANLMLVPETKDSTWHATVKILDVGLGRVLFDEGEAPAEENIEVTTAGELLGAPDYMAPEQARDAHAADIRADIYSLGCVFYHCLTGQPPFPDKNPMNKIVRHATEMPRPLKDFNPAVPDVLQQTINRMLAKGPAQRYPTPEQAAQALQLLQTAGPEQVAAPQVKPQMGAYLNWMATHTNEVPLVPVGGGQAPSDRDAATGDELLGLTRREWMLIGIGAALLLLLEAVIWLMVQVFG